MPMATIIRATDRNRNPQSVAFNFDDMNLRAEEYLQMVRVEAQKIVEQAKQEGEAIRRVAERDGHARAMQAVATMVEKRLATVLPALRQMVGDMKSAKQEWLIHWETSGVQVAAAIAKRVIRRELSVQPDITEALVREALELAAGSAKVRIRMNPADCEAMGEQRELLLAEFAAVGSATFVPDEAIGRGGCRVETDFGVIDQQIDVQLARIEEELTQ